MKGNMMATNVTQKDKTLHEIIAFAEEYERAEKAVAAIHKHNGEYEDATWYNGRLSAFQTIEKHCKAMLGYGGSMPLEVPNQSEDAK